MKTLHYHLKVAIRPDDLSQLALGGGGGVAMSQSQILWTRMGFYSLRPPYVCTELSGKEILSDQISQIIKALYWLSIKDLYFDLIAHLSLYLLSSLNFGLYKGY